MADVSVSGGELRTPVGDAPVLPLAILGIGMYLAWFGVHYWRSDVKWPSAPVKNVLTGQPLPAAAPQPSYSSQLSSDVTALQPDSGSAASAGTGGGSGSSAGGVLNHAQLESLWTGNGGSQATANLAAAIAQAESSGNSLVTSPNPDGGMNIGLWQLDTRGKGAGYTVAQLQDPATNARVAIMGSANGTNWSAWQTYGSGAYTAYLHGG